LLGLCLGHRFESTLSLTHSWISGRNWEEMQRYEGGKGMRGEKSEDSEMGLGDVEEIIMETATPAIRFRLYALVQGLRRARFVAGTSTLCRLGSEERIVA